MSIWTAVLRVMPEAVAGPDGTGYVARVCGRLTTDNGWVGWIEFVSSKSGQVLRSTLETTQPNFRNLEGWAHGLTEAHLEEALQYTLGHQRPRYRGPPAPWGEAYYPGPAPTPSSRRAPQSR